MGISTINRRQFLKTVGIGTTALVMPKWLQAAQEQPKRSNIIVIVADDLGYGELGCQGNKQIPTPHIDSIASNGVRFTNGYVSCPVCSPTRAGLITGRYQQRFGHEFNTGRVGATVTPGLPLSETTLASRLKSAGYSTGMVGKWHLGFAEKFRPMQRGFDEFYGFLGGAHSYLDLKPQAQNSIFRGSEPVDEKEYLTDAFGREAVASIERHKNDPFFLYLTFNAVHSPLQAPAKYLDRVKSISNQKRRNFAAMLTAMDDAVGNVLAALRKNGLEDNTLIFFVSDNGGPTLQTTSMNGSLRGFKGQVYEGGIRVPFMAQWKGQIPAGKTYDKPVISLDIAPTALAAAGVKADNAKFDGVDLLPYLLGKSSDVPHQTLYWRFGEQCAIRDGNWKLVKVDGDAALYDLSTDIAEKTNLAADKPEVVKELSEKYAKWNSELATPLWRRQPGPRQRARRNAGRKATSSQ